MNVVFINSKEQVKCEHQGFCFILYYMTYYQKKCVHLYCHLFAQNVSS